MKRLAVAFLSAFALSATVALPGYTAPQKGSAAPAATLKVMFKGGQVAHLLQMLAEAHNKNVVIDKSVGDAGECLSSLGEVSFDEALDAIARQYNLSVKKDGGIIFVTYAPPKR